MYDFNWNKAGEEKKATGIEITQRKSNSSLGNIIVWGATQEKTCQWMEGKNAVKLRR